MSQNSFNSLIAYVAALCRRLDAGTLSLRPWPRRVSPPLLVCHDDADAIVEEFNALFA